jgi:hypothetical protein
MRSHHTAYVLLRFVPRTGNISHALELAVVIGQDAVVEIVIRYDWQTGLDAEDREYLADLMRDWSTMSLRRPPALLRQLSELSVGPLTVLDTGVATSESLRCLTRKVLTNCRSAG